MNEYWTLDEALELLPQMPLQYCEQPLPAGDPDGPELKRRSPVPIYVDEDCHTLADVAPCAERAHGINIKLAKSGGIREAVRMAHAARALGLGVMLGCMVESGLGIAAGAQIASLCDHVDLDGNLLLAARPVARRRPSRTASSFPPTGRGSVSRERRLAPPGGGLLRATRTTARRRAGSCATGPEQVVALLDSERAGETTEGFPSSARVDEALAPRSRRPRSSASPPPAAASRRPGATCSTACIAAGLDLENGLHEFISDDPELAALAARHGVELRDLRKPPAGLNVPTGENLTHGAKVVLTVGSDCAIGKMTVALELDAAARRRGVASEFVPTGQTGIAIAGWGISVDAVVADFIAGAVRAARARGSRRAAASSSGSRARARCSIRRTPASRSGCCTAARPTRSCSATWPGSARRRRRALPDARRSPSWSSCTSASSLLARPAKVVAIALNTRDLDEAAARAAVAAAEAETGLPADDPVRFGGGEGLADPSLEAARVARLEPAIPPSEERADHGEADEKLVAALVLLAVVARRQRRAADADRRRQRRRGKYETTVPVFFMPTMQRTGWR